MERATLVIPCFNAANVIGRTLEAVNRLTDREELRVMVVDNNSNDETRVIGLALADEVLVEQRRGSFAARNAGLAACETKWFLSLDADTRPLNPDWAALHIEALSASTENTLATGGPLLPEPSSDWWSMRPDVTPHPSWDGANLLYAVGGNRCARTDLLRSLGGFPPVGADDAGLGRLARVAGLRFQWVEQAAVYHHNSTGLRGYYSQMRKVGDYTAELDPRPPWFLPRQAMRLLGNIFRFPQRGPRETVAEIAKTTAITAGSIARWRQIVDVGD